MYSIWLTFEPRVQDHLRQIIHRYQDRFGGPGFEAHVTLVGDIERPIDEIRRICQTLVAPIGSQTIGVGTLAGTDAYFMALYLNTDLPEILNVLRHDLSAALLPNPKKIDPAHISLAYAAPNLAEQIGPKDRDFLPKEGDDIVANKIEIVEAAKSRPIDQWRTVTTINLAPHV